MKCPQCGTEFDGTVQQCFTCGWDFNDDPAGFNPRTSKLAVVSLVLGIVCLLMLYLPLLPTVIVGTIALRCIRKSRGRLTGERLAMAGILVPLLSFPVMLTIGYAVWSKDAGPVPNEFTEADLIQVRPENEATWDILCQLNDVANDPAGAPAIGLNFEDVALLEELFETIADPNTAHYKMEVVSQRSEDIQYLWDKSGKGRAVIEQLAAHMEIADLTKPDIESDMPYLKSMKKLGQINVLKVLSLIETEQTYETCQELVKFNQVVNKYSLSSRSIISKLVCYAVFAMDIQAANSILNSPYISHEEIIYLQEHFSVSEKELSLKNCYIYEYLTFKNSSKSIMAGVNTSLYKHNSICRYYSALCRNWILVEEGKDPYDYCQVSVWPWETPVSPKVSLDIEQVSDNYLSLYFFYNPTGMMNMMIMFPAVEKLPDIKNKVLIRDDMLQWVFAQRLGQEGSLKARAYSDEYTVDLEKGLVFSVGPDGEAYTDDDIKLRIDPVVLGLTNEE